MIPAGDRWHTYWRTIEAWRWNEHHDSTAPPGCEWVLVGAAFELDGELIASMGFALTPELMEQYDMDRFIDEVAFAELLAEIEKVRPVGDVVVNSPGALRAEPSAYARAHG